MKDFFEIKNGLVISSTKEQGKIIVYSVPTEIEKKELLETLQLDQHALDSALDPDEISRVEFTPEHTYIIWKRPNAASFKDLLKFEVSSLGIFLSKDKVTLILGEETVPFTAKEFQRICCLKEFVLKFLLHTIHHFFGHLKAMRMLNAELQSKLNMSMENEYLLQMFNLSESLIYYLNALEANAPVLTKLRTQAEKVALSTKELEMLDDLMIENQQCSRQTEIYSSVLSGLMDARGNIINNNMNILLRNLTLINVVFLPLNLIASVGGMSEYSKVTEGVVDWRIAYTLFFIGMAVLGVITWSILVRQMNKQKVVKSLSSKLKKT